MLLWATPNPWVTLRHHQLGSQGLSAARSVISEQQLGRGAKAMARPRSAARALQSRHPHARCRGRDGKQRPTHGSCFLAKPCCVPSSGLGCHHAGEWRQWLADGWDGDCGSTHGRVLTVLTAAARGAGGWESLARPPARSCDPRSLRGAWVPLPCPPWAGGFMGTRVSWEGVGALAAHTPSRAGHRPISSPWGPGSARMDPLRCLIGFYGHVTVLKNIIIKLQNAAHKLALESDSADKWNPCSR